MFTQNSTVLCQHNTVCMSRKKSSLFSEMLCVHFITFCDVFVSLLVVCIVFMWYVCMFFILA